MTTRDLVFTGIALVTAASALLAVTTRHVVHAALWLLVSLGTLAGCYVVLGQELVGLVQLLVYVGAVVVLVLFALMLTRAPIGPSTTIHTPAWHRTVAAALGAATTALLAVVVLPLVWRVTVDVDAPAPTTAEIGRAIFGPWVWPFELLSVLLLVALVGAFAVSRLAAGPDERPRAAATGARTDPDAVAQDREAVR